MVSALRANLLAYLDAAVWLKRRVPISRIRRIDQYGPRDFVHRFYIRQPSDIDPELLALLTEARSVGDQDFPMAASLVLVSLAEAGSYLLILASTQSGFDSNARPETSQS